MSRNGSGTYVLPTGNPVVTGTTITSNWANTTFSDVATALTGSVAADGQTPMTGPLAMGNNKITGVADGTASSDVATVNQISNPNITGGSIDGTPIGNISPSTGKFTTLSANAGATLTGTCTAPTVTPGSDNTTKIATTAFVQSAIASVSSGVTSFNSRTGVVTLSSGDVTTALGYTPYNSGGATVITTSNISSYAPGPTGSGASGNWGINITGNAATVTNGVYTNANNTFSGSSGNTFSTPVAIGTTVSSIYNLSVTGQSGQPAQLLTSNTGGGSIGLLVNMVNSNPSAVVFQYSGTTVGSIMVGSSSTTYQTYSDRRLKSNIVDLANSGTFIDAIKPRSFTWNIDGKSSSGFIADELQQVVPDAISGTPNAVDIHGNPLYQGIDCSTPEMMANMIAELQSLRKRVATLEAKG